MDSYWKDKHFSFISNRECEYFPCHKTDDPDNFNCLFCYCPLYPLGEACGGNFSYTPQGFKDCSECIFPHLRDSYPKIVERYSEICVLAARRRRSRSECR